MRDRPRESVRRRRVGLLTAVRQVPHHDLGLLRLIDATTGVADLAGPAAVRLTDEGDLCPVRADGGQHPAGDRGRLAAADGHGLDLVTAVLPGREVDGLPTRGYRHLV